MVAVTLGTLSFAAVKDVREPDQCGPFTIGKSALGGCDWLAGP